VISPYSELTKTGVEIRYCVYCAYPWATPKSFCGMHEDAPNPFAYQSKAKLLVDKKSSRVI